ncbi:hypothetical protein Tco_0680517 [Tanacetum coccineum]|uniref:Uncharacterized protein n=1 Tax=Tanacetum coccineum TaxID=301880 RepID=A0ABQ4XKT2_9ASTR
MGRRCGVAGVEGFKGGRDWEGTLVEDVGVMGGRWGRKVFCLVVKEEEGLVIGFRVELHKVDITSICERGKGGGGGSGGTRKGGMEMNLKGYYQNSHPGRIKEPSQLKVIAHFSINAAVTKEFYYTSSSSELLLLAYKVTTAEEYNCLKDKDKLQRKDKVALCEYCMRYL